MITATKKLSLMLGLKPPSIRNEESNEIKEKARPEMGASGESSSNGYRVESRTFSAEDRKSS